MLEKLTPKDIEDRKVWQELFEVMNRQGAVGITQPLDYRDSIWYQENLEDFKKQYFPEGDIVEHYDDIIFDFDGVLYDSTEAVYYGALELLKHFVPENEHANLTLEGIANSYYSPFQDYFKRFGIDLDDPKVKAEFHKYYLEVCYPEAQRKYPEHFYPDAVVALKRLKEEKIKNPNLRIHIVSAKKDGPGRKLLEEAGLTEFLDDIHFEAHDKKKAIGEIATKSGNPERCIMIGDLPSDVKDAQTNVGVKSVAVARGVRGTERLGHYLPDYIVSDLSGLFDLKSHSKALLETNHSKTRQEWDDFAEFQRKYHGEQGHVIRQRIYNPVMFEMIGSVDGKSFLDAGCGNGNFAPLLQGKPQKIVLLDQSPNLIRDAKNANPDAETICQNLESTIPLHDDSLDTVYSNIALDYVNDWSVFAREVFRILKPGGKLVVGVQHPFFHQEAQRLGDDRYDKKFGYFNSGEVKRRIYGELHATTYPKTIGQNINVFLEAGLHLTSMKEVGYQESDADILTQVQKQEIGVPRFLFLNFEK